MKIIYSFLFSMLAFSMAAQNIKPPTFSVESGFYTQEFNLLLNHNNTNVKIIYTTDGSEPSMDNINGKVYNYKTKYPQFGGQQPFEMHQNYLYTLVYSAPILVYDRTTEPNRAANISTTYEFNQYFPLTKVDKSFVVRAKAYLDQNNYSETVTKVYFLDKQYSFPVLNVNVDEDALFSYENGLWVAGKAFDNWRIANPEVNDYQTTVPANYWASGALSEVPVNIVYLEDQTEKINQTVGIRNHGNGSRFFKNRSYRMYAKSDYGTKDLKHSFFTDSPYDSFKRLIVRNSGNDTYRTMFRDAFIQKLNQHLNFDTQKYQPIITFVNGEYYGLMNLRERYDEKYFERVYNIKEKDLDFLENQGLADIGDNTQYFTVVDFFKNNSLSGSYNYKKALTYIDEINFTDYQIAEIFAANFDWPHNNNTYFRKRVNYTPKASYGQDGRFRWVLKDMDAGFNGIDEWINNSYNHNTLSSAIEHQDYILKGLLTNKSYKNYFLNRFADLLNTSYKEQHIIGVINSMQDNIKAEMPKYIERWNLIKSMQDWENRVEQLREFARLRPNIQYQHLHNYFNINGNYPLTVQTNDKNKGFVKVNTIEINNSTIGIDADYQSWTGQYFKNVAVTLQAIAHPGYKFSHWSGGVVSTKQKIVVNSDSELKVKAIFIKEHVTNDLDKVDFIIYPNPTDNVLNIASASQTPIAYKIFDLTGQMIQENTLSDQKINVSHLKKGIYIIELNQNNKKIVKKFIKK